MLEVRHGSRVFRLPFAGLFRPLTGAEETDLTTSLRAIGVGHPVFVYDSPTFGADCVIDGANRLRIGEAEGLDVPVQKLTVSDETARRMAEDLNIARRQVSPEEASRARAERIERVVAAREDEKSLRAIAAEEGVSAEQVRRDLQDAIVTGVTIEIPKKITGLGGRGYPATRPAPELKPDEKDTDVGEEEEPEDEPAAPESTLRPDRRPKWMRNGTGGSKVDPNHPYAELLTAFSNLARLVTISINNEADNDRLRETLTTHSKTMRRTLMVEYIAGKFQDGEKIPATIRFVGLRPLRALIRKAGNSKKPLTQKQIESIFDTANTIDAPEDGE